MTIKKYELGIKQFNTAWEAATITTSKDVDKIARLFFKDDLYLYESFFVITLDAGGVTTGYFKISQGGISGTVVDTSIIVKFALDTLCRGVVLVHNHPSGRTEPSEADIRTTKEIKAALNLFRINLHDHVILAGENFYSFADDGRI